jgi:hypothetical protein
MFIADLLVALGVGFVVVWVVSVIFDTKGPWDSFPLFFLVVAVFAWAGGVWLVPFGPIWWGIGWLPITVMGIFAALLLTAASPRTPRKRAETQEKEMATLERRAGVNAVLWVLIICLFLFAFAHYAWHYTWYP